MPWSGTTFLRVDSMNTGCSARQATHQEAKTLTSETSPRRFLLDSPNVLPLTGGRSNSGTFLPIRVDGSRLGSRLRPRANTPARTTKPVAGKARRSRRRAAETFGEVVGWADDCSLMFQPRSERQ